MLTSTIALLVRLVPRRARLHPAAPSSATVTYLVAAPDGGRAKRDDAFTAKLAAVIRGDR